MSRRSKRSCHQIGQFFSFCSRQNFPIHPCSRRKDPDLKSWSFSDGVAMCRTALSLQAQRRPGYGPVGCSGALCCTVRKYFKSCAVVAGVAGVVIELTGLRAMSSAPRRTTMTDRAGVAPSTKYVKFGGPIGVRQPAGSASAATIRLDQSRGRKSSGRFQRVVQRDFYHN